MPDVHVPDLTTLEKYLQVTRNSYDACFSCLENKFEIDAPRAELQYHFLKPDPTGTPKVQELADSLVAHLAAYAFRAESLPQTLDPVSWGALLAKARRLLRKWLTSGEPGEIVLYMLIEALLRAPQIIAKLELKMNPGLEQHGSDGVHARWNHESQRLELVIGEAKFQSSAAAAAKNAAASILRYHEKRLLAHEIGLLSPHFKWADSKLKESIISTVDPISGTGEFDVVHACLLGYDWPGYESTVGSSVHERMASIADAYTAELDQLRGKFLDGFDALRETTLRFVVFHLPLPSVQAFRSSFLAALG